jgi:hypothetical protein
MSFSLVKSECVDMTKELAEEFQNLHPSPTERDFDPLRVRHLENKAKKGFLVTFHWAKAKLNGKMLRVNGQHSSAMLCGLNGEFPPGLRAHVDEYHLQEEKDLAVLFRQFDDRKSSRGARDVAGAYQNLEAALVDVPNPSAKLAIDGIAWYARNVEGAPVPSGDDVYEWFHRSQYHEFIIWLGELLGIKTPELRRNTIVAAMYATWISNEDECKKFWLSVARGGEEYEEGSPAAVLDEWYTAIKKKECKETPKPGAFYQAGLYCWNAHMQAKQIKTIKIDVTKGWITPLSS